MVSLLVVVKPVVVVVSLSFLLSLWWLMLMLMLMLFVVDALLLTNLPGKGIVTCHMKSQGGGEVGQLSAK